MNQPKSVAIDVAVDIAKKYSSDDSYKFINGVLDNCEKSRSAVRVISP